MIPAKTIPNLPPIYGRFRVISIFNISHRKLLNIFVSNSKIL
ncbi:hypothetical protein LEP1GSC008_2744 [Leptospira kirschneri serovar Bulgarica str. Nikolaevo]|uniref:Uncharacterized protein n=1 Tax=Leptospira kirschneri serovar Bulgarica str. Nikolaevo TaxID=1240687 RepID=M6FIS3_9LEPT|nr:hypothetical protein LEP1GSC008_2744 [Leptospira kirschneri serovar Bulgarica str. Nikolaevo]